MNKLDKLTELGKLLKSGAISQIEFNNLKNELLNPDNSSTDNPKLKELNELLECGIITQEEFNSLKNEESTNSKQKAKPESSQNKRPPEINRKPPKIEKKTLNGGVKVNSGSNVKYYLLYGLGIIIFIFFKTCDFNSSNSSNSKSESKNNSSEKVNRKCSRCFGSGKVATYSAMTCTLSHFTYGDCRGRHKSEYDCFSVGSKTCPCCKGTGKPN